MPKVQHPRLPVVAGYQAANSTPLDLVDWTPAEQKPLTSDVGERIDMLDDGPHLHPGNDGFDGD